MKTGSIIKKSGKYYFVVDLERGEDNKRKQKWFSGFNTREEAERFKINYLYERYNYSFENNGNLTLKDWLDKWLKNYIEPRKNLECTTKDGYKTNVNNHIIPSLGHIPINKLTPERIDDFYAKKMSGDNGEKPLSSTTVLYIHRTLKLALKTARKKGHIKINFADYAEIPAKEKFKATVLDELELQKYSATLKDTPMYLPFLLGAGRGLRRGEILGLRWNDVDLENGLIYVRQTVVKVKKEIIFKCPKTTNSIRTTDIPPPAIDYLNKLKSSQTVFNQYNLIFCKKDGSPLCPPSFSSNFAKILKKHNLPQIRFHDLRHTFCTVNIEKGIVDYVDVSQTVGHNVPSFTVDHYGSNRKKGRYGLYRDYDSNFS